MPPSKALKGLLTACVLVALALSTVESYKCKRCPLNACHPNTQTTCETSQSCFSYREEFDSPTQPLAFVEEKGCSEAQCVPLSFSATLQRDIRFRYGHSCCHSDQCNQGDFQVPQQTSVPNGIKCPACYSVNDVPCDPELFPCTGAETKCVKVNGSDVTGIRIFAMGCATESICNWKNMHVLGGASIHVQCVSSRAASPPVLPTTSQFLTALILLQAWLWWFRPCQVAHLKLTSLHSVSLS